MGGMKTPPYGGLQRVNLTVGTGERARSDHRKRWGSLSPVGFRPSDLSTGHRQISVKLVRRAKPMEKRQRRILFPFPDFLLSRYRQARNARRSLTAGA